GAVPGKIEVVLNDKRSFNARIVGADPSTDLAVLKIDAQNLPSITIGNSNKVNVGEWVLAIGNPFRLRSTVTAGIVSALSRDVQIIDDNMRVESFIQTDAAINKGNSGGALVNTSGELVGVNTAIASQTGSYQGYGFAIPSNLASKVARDIIQYGEVHRALLGVTIASVNSRMADELNMDKIEGVEITRVDTAGAAYKSGVKPGDVILSVNGAKVNESNQLQEKIAVLNPGEVVDLKIWRDGKTISKSVKLDMLDPGKQQLAFSQTLPQDSTGSGYFSEQDGHSGNRHVKFAHFDFGFRVMALSKADNPKHDHIVITDVVKGSVADKQGLEEGDTILMVGNQKVEDLQSMKDLIAHFLNDNNSVTLQIFTQNGETKLVKLNQ
ncbi:MAG TPA: trypsin-like peptidase domain-containing protein, partial [Balneolaceae bacterium]|nr:trypsin-like peptidase domain-containing protein [Balneolaceae bacterium]